MLKDTSEADWDYQTIPKLKGAFNTMKHAVPYMIEQKFGRIINVASDAWLGMPGLAAYSAANAGLVGLTKSTARELAQYGVTVNAICPQAESPGHLIHFNIAVKKIKVDAKRLKDIEAAHGPAEDAAPFAVYLATKEAEYINGAVFSVTGDSRVSVYTDPMVVNRIKKDDGPWTMEELIETVPKTLLKDYVSIVKTNI